MKFVLVKQFSPLGHYRMPFWEKKTKNLTNRPPRWDELILSGTRKRDLVANECIWSVSLNIFIQLSWILENICFPRRVHFTSWICGCHRTHYFYIWEKCKGRSLQWQEETKMHQAWLSTAAACFSTYNFKEFKFTLFLQDGETFPNDWKLLILTGRLNGRNTEKEKSKASPWLLVTLWVCLPFQSVRYHPFDRFSVGIAARERDSPQ